MREFRAQVAGYLAHYLALLYATFYWMNCLASGVHINRSCNEKRPWRRLQGLVVILALSESISTSSMTSTAR